MHPSPGGSRTYRALTTLGYKLRTHVPGYSAHRRNALRHLQWDRCGVTWRWEVLGRGCTTPGAQLDPQTSPLRPGALPGAPNPPARPAAATASSPAADAAGPHLGQQCPDPHCGHSGSRAAGSAAAATPRLRGARVPAPHPHRRPQEVHPHQPGPPRLGVGPARPACGPALPAPGPTFHPHPRGSAPRSAAPATP